MYYGDNNGMNDSGIDLKYHGGKGDDEVIREHRPPSSYTNPNSGMPLFVMWLLLTGGITVYLSLKYELWTVYFFVMQAIPGAVLFFTSEKLRRTKNLLIYMFFVAAFCGGLAYLRITFPIYFETMSGHFLTNLFIDVLCVIALGLVLYVNTHENNMRRRCTAAVDGTVVRMLTMRLKSSKVYCPVYRFTFGSKRYEASEYKYYKHNVPQVGETAGLLIDPEDPVTIRKVDRAIAEVKIKTIAGILLFISGLMLMLLLASSGHDIF